MIYILTVFCTIRVGQGATEAQLDFFLEHTHD